jgi:hypothetical protein
VCLKGTLLRVHSNVLSACCSYTVRIRTSIR